MKIAVRPEGFEVRGRRPEPNSVAEPDRCASSRFDAGLGVCPLQRLPWWRLACGARETRTDAAKGLERPALPERNADAEHQCGYVCHRRRQVNRPAGIVDAAMGLRRRSRRRSMPRRAHASSSSGRTAPSDMPTAAPTVGCPSPEIPPLDETVICARTGVAMPTHDSSSTTPNADRDAHAGTFIIILNFIGVSF